MDIRKIIQEEVRKVLMESENKVMLKSKTEIGNQRFKMLKNAEYHHYTMPKGKMSPFTSGEEDRKRIVSKLSKADKEIYRAWLKTPEGKESIKLFQSQARRGSESDIRKLVNETFESILEGKKKKKPKKRNTFKKLQDNKVALTKEERAEVMKKKAVWHFSPGNKPSPAVWKSKDPKTGKFTFVTHTHRAYNTAPTLKGAIGRFHDFIKGTS